jgi:hypothetical protein
MNVITRLTPNDPHTEKLVSVPRSDGSRPGISKSVSRVLTPSREEN